MAFKLTYATMFNPPEELHRGFDGAVTKGILKRNTASRYVSRLVTRSPAA